MSPESSDLHAVSMYHNGLESEEHKIADAYKKIQEAFDKIQKAHQNIQATNTALHNLAAYPSTKERRATAVDKARASLEKAKALYFKEVSAAQDLVASRVGSSNIPLVYTNKAMRNRACYTRHGIVSVIHVRLHWLIIFRVLVLQRVEHCVLGHRLATACDVLLTPARGTLRETLHCEYPLVADPGCGLGLGLGGPLDLDSVLTATAIMKAGRRRPCEDNANDGRVAHAACACSEWKTGVAVGCRQQQQQRPSPGLYNRSLGSSVNASVGRPQEKPMKVSSRVESELLRQGGKLLALAGEDWNSTEEAKAWEWDWECKFSAPREGATDGSAYRSACVTNLANEKLRMHCMDSDVTHLRNVAQHGAETPPVRLEAVRLVCLLRILVLHLQHHERVLRISGKCRARTAGSIAGNPDFKPSCSFGSEATGPRCLCDASRRVLADLRQNRDW
ncbi:hypothetical protein B0H17DRAFT_1286217 [Mycena rosella]|uniref:Uncharacterized protein n=1 Tax=Mycena rosella TaxID=1033263 RepID=A0AAD7FJ02_MYCRO|nr:hypothetical protein B0H17DRAFT_1286217 [Mycena rosella]